MFMHLLVLLKCSHLSLQRDRRAKVVIGFWEGDRSCLPRRLHSSIKEIPGQRDGRDQDVPSIYRWKRLRVLDLAGSEGYIRNPAISS
jgi:hypothetical protein